MNNRPVAAFGLLLPAAVVFIDAPETRTIGGLAIVALLAFLASQFVRSEISEVRLRVLGAILTILMGMFALVAGLDQTEWPWTLFGAGIAAIMVIIGLAKEFDPITLTLEEQQHEYH